MVLLYYSANCKHLCFRCDIGDSALIQNVIHGINDPVFKISFLHVCQNIGIEGKKLKIYEKLRIDCGNVKLPKPVKFKPKKKLNR